jgi:transketolase N-terminal domain/subunit
MQKAEKMQELRVFAQEIRVETLKTVGSLGFGHVPGAMSVIDALAVLYGEVLIRRTRIGKIVTGAYCPRATLVRLCTLPSV